MDINQEKNQGKITNYLADQITINNALAPPQPLIEIPQNIPYIGTDIFLGRVKDLENIHQILDKNQSLAITSVTGMGGVGKTELALQYALRYQQNYSGGICWIEAKRSDIMGQIISFCQSVDWHLAPSNKILVLLEAGVERQEAEGVIVRFYLK